MHTVAVLSLGGTIAMVAPADGGPVVPALSAADLIEAVPGLAASGIQVRVIDVRQLPGASLSMTDVRDVARVAAEQVDAGATGVVVTQGTDTIEESAFALDVLWDRPAPLVVTGAMRHSAMAGADGPGNLLAAVRTAASPAVRGVGCVVVAADEIHAARWVRKMHTTSTGAFGSPVFGPIGYVVEGAPRVGWHLRRHLPLPIVVTRAGVRVVLVTAVLGDDGDLLRDLAGRYAGVVIAGFGVGHVPAAWLDSVTDLSATVPVVLASRIGVGPTLTSTYGFPGSESDLLARGLIGAGWLDPYKARILLYLLLESGADRPVVEKTFDIYARVSEAP